jgi:hypothetical protein
MLAEAAGSTGKEWRAYLSAEGVNARDRIGSGPWYNAKGQPVALDVDNLHSDSDNFTKVTALTEKGEMVPGFGDDTNKARHPDRQRRRRHADAGQDLQRLDQQQRRHGDGRPLR